MRWYNFLAGVLMWYGAYLVACTTQPSCYDTPRNMQCMTATQLERELRK